MSSKTTRAQARVVAHALVLDARGSASVEYILVLSLVAVGIAAAMTLAGALLLRLYLFQQCILLLPFP